MTRAPDIQPIVGALAQCILMQERWAAGCLYLHDAGDDEAAYEAMTESDRWRDRAQKIDEFMRQRKERPECTCSECGQTFQESQRHPQDRRALCPRCRREVDQD